MRSIAALFFLALTLPLGAAEAQTQRNVVFFIPDGLRPGVVTPETAPTFARVRDQGVNFINSHAQFPTLTMPNSAAMSSGHYTGDTGPFGNTIFSGFPLPSTGGNIVPMIENDAMMGDMNDHYSGNFLNEEAILAAARRSGYATAAIGKVGPILSFDVAERSGALTVIVDDATGRPGGIPLSPELSTAMKEAGVPLQAPARGENGKTGDWKTPGTLSANLEQQGYFVDVTTKVVLPRLKAAGKPFVLVFWSRDPDGTQHYQGDSLNQLVPGINGPTSMAAIKNADANLAAIWETLRALGLEATTDIVVSADHGFSTISKDSHTSPAAKLTYGDVPAGKLPPGFLSIDLAQTLALPLFDPDAKTAPVDPQAGQHPSKAGGVIGKDPAAPDMIVAPNGGVDLIYLPQKNAKELAPKIVDFLLGQDYVSGIFVDDALGDIAGTLPLSAINLKGTAKTPLPAIIVNFRSFGTGCADALVCAAEIADHTLNHGQGMHGNFSRADTANFMAAIGPDFRKGYVNSLPVSNADIGVTLAQILGLKVAKKGDLLGRVMTESLNGGATPDSAARFTRMSRPAANGLQTVLKLQAVGNTLYFDAAGFPGRTVGLDHPTASTVSTVSK
jgi:arylsulfatase A-like enzyme